MTDAHTARVAAWLHCDEPEARRLLGEPEELAGRIGRMNEMRGRVRVWDCLLELKHRRARWGYEAVRRA